MKPSGSPATLRLDETGPAAAELEVETLTLRILSGPGAGRSLTSTLELVRVGSGPDNDLVLEDPAISRNHLELRRVGGHWELADLGSTNGTRVGGAKIATARIEGKVRVELGRVSLELLPRTQVVRAPVEARDTLGPLVGGSPAMRRLYARIEAVAGTQATVLIEGETGTGKELVARAIHERSGRPGPLVVFDASTADPATMRSDLFGHRKGAFTGADSDRAGAFREADRGTLFVDEIGELPPDLQPRLLRCLETREVVPMGTDRPIRVDVRVVAATHRDLPARVRDGTFRADLFHRLAVVTLRSPPLRERLEDLPLLAETIASRIGCTLRLAAGELERLARHPWPGNVRELRNLIERRAALGPEASFELAAFEPAAGGGTRPAPSTLEETERARILEVLAAQGGNRTRAAKALGIGLATLKRKLKAYLEAGIPVP